MLEKILEEIESMPYNAEAIGCGLEDECITDRYDAAAYGYNAAIRGEAYVNGIKTTYGPMKNMDHCFDLCDDCLTELFDFLMMRR